MNTRTRWLLVPLGYVVAVVASVTAVAIYDRHFTAEDNQTMGGMIAGGEMLYGLGVFALVALFPTALALWSLRRHRGFWSVFSVACVTFAALGLAAVVSLLVARETRNPWLGLGSLFAVIQMLGSPLWASGFALFAALAPAPDLRRRLLLSVAIELAIGACALVHFTMSRPPY